MKRRLCQPNGGAEIRKDVFWNGSKKINLQNLWQFLKRNTFYDIYFLVHIFTQMKQGLFMQNFPEKKSMLIYFLSKESVIRSDEY